MSRAQTAVDHRTGRITLGLAHEFYGAFTRQGGTPEMLQNAQEDPEAMLRVITAMNPNPTPLQALLRAIEIGVTESEGVFKYWDPGLSIGALYELPLLKPFIFQGWNQFTAADFFAECQWWKKKDAPVFRTLRLIVEGSDREKTRPQQIALLSSDGKVPTARVMATFFFLWYIQTGTVNFFLDTEGGSFVRVMETTSKGQHICVGYEIERGHPWDTQGVHLLEVADDHVDDGVAISELL